MRHSGQGLGPLHPRFLVESLQRDHTAPHRVSQSRAMVFSTLFGGGRGWGRMTPHSLLKSRDSLTLSRVWAQGYFEIPARPVPDSRKLPHGQKYASIVCLLPLPGSSLCLGCCCPRTQPRSLKTFFKAQALGFSSVLPFNSQSIRTGCSN